MLVPAYAFQLELSLPSERASLSKHNAAPEWQARTLERKQVDAGGLSTRGACYAALFI